MYLFIIELSRNFVFNIQFNLKTLSFKNVMCVTKLFYTQLN